MVKAYLAVGYMLLFTSPLNAQAQPASNLPKNDAVRLRFMETVSSANSKVGQTVSLEVVDPVTEDDHLIVAAGAHATAVVSVSRRRGHNHRDGHLVLTMQTVQSVSGTQLHLQSAALTKGTGKGAGIFGPCTFPFPADPVGLFRKGQEVVIPAGTELTANVSY